MIKTIADLLEAFRSREVELLDKQSIIHAPTIGSMYEGLSRVILQRALPTESDLRVVSGFITNNNGELSKQIDCMLVSGEGERIPYTDNYKYHVRNVITVVEVKKKLYSGELHSAYKNLATVQQMRDEDLPENRLFNDAHRAILHSDPDTYGDVTKLPLWKFQIGLALYLESITPVRIVLGYHGFASESSFRTAFIKYLEKNVRISGYSPVDLPNLMICGGYSLIKLDGMPFSIPVVNSRQDLYAAFGISDVPADAPLDSDLWPLYASYANNPMVLLLELVWTRLAYSKMLPASVFGLDLDIEVLRPLLLAKAVEQDRTIGWYYEHFALPPQVLIRIPPTANWQPVELNEGQFVVLAHLVRRANAGISKPLKVNSPQLLAEFQNWHYSLGEAIEFLRRVGLISVDGDQLRLLTRQLKIVALPDDRVVAGEDVGGRFTHWVAKYMEDYDAEGKGQ